MLLITLILALALLCTAAVQFFYLSFLGRMHREACKRIAQLERVNQKLARDLREIEILYRESQEQGEAWPQVLAEKDSRL